MPRRFVPLIAAFAVVLLSAVVGWQVLPIHRTDSARLSQLVPSVPPPGYKSPPASASSGNPAVSTYSEVKTAARTSPQRTGVYSIAWTGTKIGDGASVQVSVLPSDAQAEEVLAEAVKASLSTGSYSSVSYRYHAMYAVPAIAGARGASYLSTSSGSQPLCVFALRYGRAVAVGFINESLALPQTQSAAVSLADDEFNILRAEIPGFTIATTSWSVSATTTWIAATAAVALLVIATPWLSARRRNRRREAREAVARRQLHGRGSKIARRQAGTSHAR